MTPTELLKSTIEYFASNPTTKRCISKKSKCSYSPENADMPLSEGCAIGRFLKPEVQKIFDKEENTGIEDIVNIESNYVLLPEWMKSTDAHFLCLIQELHDSNENWTKDGISEMGIKDANNIIRWYALDMDIIPYTYKFGSLDK